MTGNTGIVTRRRIVSGMRVTGRMHLGNYHGALKNWLRLQNEFDCYFFAADWHALTTNYEQPGDIAGQSLLMVQDWLAAGLDPNKCKIYIQSGVPEHAELHLLLSMLTPLSWLERVPTYKDQQEKLKDKDLSTYGFLGYPLLQSADILVYKPSYVPVGEDQVVHVELTREIARRFNNFFGREANYQDLAEAALGKLGTKNAKIIADLVKRYQQKGDLKSLERARDMLVQQSTLLDNDEQERLNGYLEGRGKIILPEPEVLLTKESKFPGLDGQKMSKSYNNTIGLTEDPASVTAKIKKMTTDPARIKRTDPGDPNKCPVWALHQIYSSAETKEWVFNGCRSAAIGCIECKGPLIESILAEQRPIIERSKELERNPEIVLNVVRESTIHARKVAHETLTEVKSAIGMA